jgi:hypothetical protein
MDRALSMTIEVRRRKAHLKYLPTTLLEVNRKECLQGAERCRISVHYKME